MSRVSSKAGELRIHDAHWKDGEYVSEGSYQTIVPQQNQIVFFPCELMHEITPVKCRVSTLRRQPLHLERMASSINNSAWLEWMAGLWEGVSRQTHAATFPPDLFYCLLDELPFTYVPRAALADCCGRQDGGISALYLNPECRLCVRGGVAGRACIA